MLATIFVDGPFQRPAAMDRFDKLVLRAAEKKRDDLINRYGDEGCSKLVNTRKGLQVSPQQKQQRPTPQPLDKSDYEETILELKKAHKELSTSMDSIESQKKQESLKELQHEASDSDQSDDLEIDALFELAWGNDVSQTTMASHRSPRSTRTKYYRTKPKKVKKIDNDDDDDKKNDKKNDKKKNKNNDKEFSKKMRKGTIRKIMKVREQKVQKLNRKTSPSVSPILPTRKTMLLV